MDQAPGTDGALAMAMGHVILREFLVDRQVPSFADYLTRFTDAPFLVTLEPSGGTFRPGKFLTADALGEDSEHADFKPVLLDSQTGQPAVPGGSLGFRFGEAGLGRWNLDLGDIAPVLTLYGAGAESAPVDLPRFDAADGTAEMISRGVPVRRIAGRLVTTVFDLLLAQYGVGRDGLPGDWPSSYADAEQPCTPAWQEAITGVPAAAAERIGREFGRNAEESRGRSMIIVGAGTNHYFHSDTIYRAFLALVTMTGCQGRNGGGWARPAPTCTRSCTPSTRPSARPGRPAATSTPSMPWPARFPNWRRRTWAGGVT